MSTLINSKVSPKIKCMSKMRLDCQLLSFMLSPAGAAKPRGPPRPPLPPPGSCARVAARRRCRRRLHTAASVGGKPSALERATASLPGRGGRVVLSHTNHSTHTAADSVSSGNPEFDPCHLEELMAAKLDPARRSDSSTPAIDKNGASSGQNSDTPEPDSDPSYLGPGYIHGLRKSGTRCTLDRVNLGSGQIHWGLQYSRGPRSGVKS